jgi:nucleotide-binding universal stress UspA family protein
MDKAPILICYDGSADAARGIETAASLLGPRRAVVLDIAPVLTASESLAAATASIVPGNAFEELNTDDANRVADRGAELARSAGFDAEPRGAIANPTWQGVVDVADEVDAAVIVLGSRGLKGLGELFKGSLSHQIAEHASRPVLIVPPHADR